MVPMVGNHKTKQELMELSGGSCSSLMVSAKSARSGNDS